MANKIKMAKKKSMATERQDIINQAENINFKVIPCTPESPFSIDPFNLIVQQPEGVAEQLWEQVKEKRPWVVGFVEKCNEVLISQARGLEALTYEEYIYLESRIGQLGQNKTNGLFVKIKEAQYMAEHHREPINSTIIKFLVQHSNAVVASVLYGDHYRAQQLIQTTSIASQVHAVNIRGTVGTTAGMAEIKTPIPAEVLNAETVIFSDDVLDTATSLARLVIERRKYRDNRKEMDEEESQLMVILKATKPGGTMGFEDAQETYERLLSWMMEERVVLAADISKNEPFDIVMREHLRNTHRRYHPKDPKLEWAEIQANIFEKRLSLHPPRWLMGGSRGRVLDTKLGGAKIVQAFKSKIAALPEEEKAQLSLLAEQSGLEKMDVSVGAPLNEAIPLLALRPDKSEDDLIEQAARVYLKCLRAEADPEPLLQPVSSTGSFQDRKAA